MRRLAPLALLLLLPAPAIAQQKQPDPAADLFKPSGPVPRVKVTVDKPELDRLRGNPRGYVRVGLRVNDQQFNDVGLHTKGAAGSNRGWDDKPGLTLNMNKFVKHQTFRGLDKFHLNNGVQDGSYFNELLANELALAMGLPACRCTHALVELNNRKVGLYVLKEGFDKVWLRRNFEDPTGNLYDGGFLTDINGNLELDQGVENDRKDLKAVVKACGEPDANKRYAAVDKLVDLDRFAAMAALQLVACDWDGYVRKPNNYRVYFDPKSGKAVFIPHGMDQMWQNPGEGLFPGWSGLVARAVLDHPDGKKKLLAKLRELSDKHFTVEKMHKRIDELTPRAKEALATVDKGAANNFEGEAKAIKERIKQRVELVKKELAKAK